MNVSARKYGLTKTQVERLHRDAKGVCAICHEPAKLNIDHDHKTNRVRGLLCKSCNHGVGNFRDSITRLQSAITYLNTHGELQAIQVQ